MVVTPIGCIIVLALFFVMMTYRDIDSNGQKCFKLNEKWATDNALDKNYLSWTSWVPMVGIAALVVASPMLLSLDPSVYTK